MKYLSLFSGIGGFEYGIEKSKKEMECIGYSEIDKYAESIYKRQFPEHKGFGDVTKLDTEQLPDFDFLVGGFPCQAFSIAGLRRGFDDTRGTLFFEIARVLRDKRPRYFLLENVKGLLSHDKGKTFKTILEVLANLGYDVVWEVLNSKNFGVPQNRERIYIKGYLRDKCGREVLCQGRDSTETIGRIDAKMTPTRNGAIVNPDGISKTLTAEGQNSGKNQFIEEDNRKINVFGYTRPSKAQSTIVYDNDGLMGTLCGNNKSQPKVKEDVKILGNIRPSGHSEGNVYAEEGICSTITRSNAPFIGEKKIISVGNVSPSGHRTGRVFSEEGITPTLVAGCYKCPPKVCEPLKVATATKKGYDEAYPGDGVRLDHPGSKTGRGRVQSESTGALMCGGQWGTVVEDDKTVTRAVLTPNRVNKRQNGRRMKEDGEPAFTVTATDRHGVYDGYRIRRLTPMECERLQGFPDNWTKYGVDGKEISDTQRYKCCGNAVTTNVITYIINNWDMK